MKKFIAIVMLVTVFYMAKAQDDEAMSKIESAKIGLITERLGLSPKQAQEFWPLYNQFMQERNSMRSEFQKQRSNLNEKNLSEEQRQRLIDLAFQFKERQLNLERQYSERLLKIISSKQLLALRKAEEDFRNMLLRKLQQRRMQQNQREQFGERLEKRREMRRNN